MEAYMNGKKLALDPKYLLGEGGEAKVYLSGGRAIKIYHPAFITKRREEKLRAFPKNLPKNIIAPIDLVSDKHGNVIGFSMEALKDVENFIQLSNKKFREKVSADKVRVIFLNTLRTLEEGHRAKIIAGDLNDLNLLFRDEEVYFIDADGMQFGKFPCEVATEQFLDPRLYGIDFSRKPVFTEESDYYAFTVLLFRSLLLVNPYGGVHAKLTTLTRRAEKRVSVFDSEVRYPKAAIPFKVLPDELLDHFFRVFEKDLRGAFPHSLIENLRWTACMVCGEMHARNICPYCAHAAPGAVKTVALVNRKCVAKIVFQTEGMIIDAKLEGGQLKFLYEEAGEVRRENGERVFVGKPDNFTRFSIMGGKTLIGRRRKIVIVERENIIGEAQSDMLGNLPVFESAEADYVKTVGGMLVQGENQILGQVLENQTWIKLGKKIGFGFYRIGMKTVYFTFILDRPGINDSVALPKIEGQLVDAECVFSEKNILFLVSTLEKGKLWNAMYLLDNQGNLIAGAKEEKDNSKILSEIHNKTLGGDKILTATDEGIMLLEADGQKVIRETKIFSDTEPFVDESVQLLNGVEGIYVVGKNNIKLLKLV